MGKNEEGVEVTLQYPITFGDEKIEKVTVRRPRGKDLKGLHNLRERHDDQLKLVARLIDQPLKVVEDMDLSTDLQTIMEATMNFLPDGQKITKTH